MTITDADREAAACIFESLLPEQIWRAANARLGNMDDLPTVQAFARHREQEATELRETVERLREEVQSLTEELAYHGIYPNPLISDRHDPA